MASIDAELFAHDHTKPTLAIHDDTIHLFVLRLGEEWKVEADRLAARFNVCASAV